MNNGLLDKREIAGAIMADGAKRGSTYSPKFFSQYMREFKVVAKDQSDLTASIVVGEVLEWLRQRHKGTHNGFGHYGIRDSDIREIKSKYGVSDDAV